MREIRLSLVAYRAVLRVVLHIPDARARLVAGPHRTPEQTLCCPYQSACTSSNYRLVGDTLSIRLLRDAVADVVVGIGKGVAMMRRTIIHKYILSHVYG